MSGPGCQLCADATDPLVLLGYTERDEWIVLGEKTVDVLLVLAVMLGFAGEAAQA